RPSPKFFASGWVAAAKISSSSAIWRRSKSKWPAIWAPLASWCSAAAQRSTTCPHCRRAINPTCASKTSALCCALFANCNSKEEANMNKPVNRFEFFHEARPPKGAEGWERMYPYFLVSQREGRDGEDKKFWFADSMHWSRAVHPFDSIGAEAVYYGVGVNSTRSIALPMSLGLDVRVVNGFVYICPLPVTDPGEIGRRAKLFEPRAGHYFKNWNGLYANWKRKMLASLEVMKALKFSKLEEFEPIEVVTEGKGRSHSWDLIENYHRLINELFLVWQYHFEMLGLGYGAYMVFFQFCKESFPEIEDQTIARMVAGIEGIMFRPGEELRRLAKLAVETNVGEALCGEGGPETILACLGQSEAGKSWIADFEKTREPWFNYFAEYGFLH